MICLVNRFLRNLLIVAAFPLWVLTVWDAFYRTMDHKTLMFGLLALAGTVIGEMRYNATRSSDPARVKTLLDALLAAQAQETGEQAPLRAVQKEVG